MKISIVTVCYNSAGTLVPALLSVFNQRREGLEIEHIVVDGGSTDGSVDRLREFAQRPAVGYSFQWLSEPDRGIYDAMNKGIRRATGDVVGIVNADDQLDGEDVLMRVAAAFDDSLEAIYGDVRFVRETKTVRYVSGRYFRKWMFRFATFPPHPATFIRRECFSRWGDYDISYKISGDFDLLVRFMWVHGMKTKYVPICTHAMSMGGVSTTRSRHFEMETEDLRSLKEHGIWSTRVLTMLRYPYKLLEFILNTH